MRQLFSFLTVLLTSVFMISCGKFHDDGTSVWQGGLWLLPWITGLGAALCWFLTIKSWIVGGTQGWEKPDGYKPEYTTDNKRFPIYQASFFWFAVALTVATIVIIIMVNASK